MLVVVGSLPQGLQPLELPFFEEPVWVLASFGFLAIYELSPAPYIYVVKI